MSQDEPDKAQMGLQKSQKVEKQTCPGQPNEFQNIGEKVGHQHRGRGTVDKIHGAIKKRRRRRRRMNE